MIIIARGKVCTHHFIEPFDRTTKEALRLDSAWIYYRIPLGLRTCAFIEASSELIYIYNLKSCFHLFPFAPSTSDKPRNNSSFMVLVVSSSSRAKTSGAARTTGKNVATHHNRIARNMASKGRETCAKTELEAEFWRTIHDHTMTEFFPIYLQHLHTKNASKNASSKSANTIKLLAAARAGFSALGAVISVSPFLFFVDSFAASRQRKLCKNGQYMSIQ